VDLRYSIIVDPGDSGGAASPAPYRGREGIMYISIARYAGAAGKMADDGPKAQRGFVPLLKGQKGFRGYAAFASEQGDLAALHIWESADMLANARSKLNEWLQANLPHGAVAGVVGNRGGVVSGLFNEP